MMNQTEYRRAYRTRHRRIEIVCECEEYDLLKNSARKHGRKLSPFVLECAFSYLREGFILPDEEAVSGLKRELRRWGNNLNQIAYHANRTQQVSAGDITQTIRLVQTLETRLDQLFREPKSLRKAIEEQVKDDPELIPRIRYILDQCKQ
jgi:uncharacterized protein (DUF1778 family)